MKMVKLTSEKIRNIYNRSTNWRRNLKSDSVIRYSDISNLSKEVEIKIQKFLIEQENSIKTRRIKSQKLILEGIILNID